MKRSEQVLRAMNGIGDDLVVMAEQQIVSRSPWQRIFSAAACLALILGTAVGFRQLTAEPVRQEPAAQEIILESPEEPVTYTVETEPEGLPFTRALNSRPFYIFDPDPENDDGPSKAISPDGTVLVETPTGQIEPLIDRLTGEYIAIMVCRRAAGTTIAGDAYDIYTLEGKNVVTGLQAYDVDCLGNIVLVQSSDGTNCTVSLYFRDTYALLRNDFGSGLIIGDCIWLVPQGDNSGTVQYIMDETGSLVMEEVPVDTYFVWEDRAYFVTGQGDSGLGLMDSKGNQLIEGKYMRVCYGISNGYARCEDADGHYLVDTATGKEVFHWDYPIVDAFENFVLLHTENYRYALADWNGQILFTGDNIRTLDDEKDGIPELFVVETADAEICFNPASGRIQASYSYDNAMLGDHISSRTATLQEDHSGVSYLVNVSDGTKIKLPRTYRTVSPILEEDQVTGLFYAAYEENGEIWYDVVREDGTVLLSGLSDMWTRQGDVFYTDDGAARGLIRLDGTWLYQETKASP